MIYDDRGKDLGLFSPRRREDFIAVYLTQGCQKDGVLLFPEEHS